MARRELRVHGVSGTDPRDILYSDPRPRTPPEPGEQRYTEVYRLPPPDPAFETEAFHWGGLTAGSRWTALWILLSPFLFANAAGWMTTDRNRRGSHAAVRLAGLGLTALLVVQGFTAAVLLPYRWLARRATLDLGLLAFPVTSGLRRTALVALALLLAILFSLLVLKASTQSHFAPLSTGRQLRLLLVPEVDAMAPPADEDEGEGEDEDPPPGEGRDDPAFADPAGASVTDRVPWAPHSILHRLRRIHFALGLGVISLAIGFWIGSAGIIVPGAVLVTGLVALTILTGGRPQDRRVLLATAWVPALAAALSIFSLIAAGAGPTQPWNPGAVHTLTLLISLGLGAAVVSSAVAGWITVGALVVATLFGAILGIAVGVVIESVLGLSEFVPNGAAWVAVASLFLLWVLAATALVLSFLPTPHTGDEGAQVLVRRVVLRAKALFVAAAVYGLVAGGVVLAEVVSRCVRDLSAECIAPRNLGVPKAGDIVYMAAITLGILLVVLIAARLATHLEWWWGAAVVAAALAVVFMAGQGFFRFQFMNVSLVVRDDLVDIAVVLAILVPGSFMLRSIWAGFAADETGRTTRRRVGILWDVGSFWPRWFHPLAPPAYGPVAVTKLGEELVANRRDVLAAHSQGSLVGAVASLLMDDVTRRPAAYLTYGSQLGSLYPTMFPDAGFGGPDGLVAKLRAAYPGRWMNLYRDTDPIGGHVVDELGPANLLVRTGTGHSRYEPTAEYREARAALLGEAPAPPGREEDVG